MTAFAARLALDCYRVQGGYTDCLPCLQLPPQWQYSSLPAVADSSSRNAFSAPGTETMTSQIEFTQSPRVASASALDLQPPEKAPPETAVNHNGHADDASSHVDADGASQQQGAAHDASSSWESKVEHEGHLYGVSPALHWYMERVHAPLLAQPRVKLLVLALFVGLGTLSLAAIPHVSR